MLLLLLSSIAWSLKEKKKSSNHIESELFGRLTKRKKAKFMKAMFSSHEWIQFYLNG